MITSLNEFRKHVSESNDINESAQLPGMPGTKPMPAICWEPPYKSNTPKIFSYTAYRLPTEEDLMDIASCQLTAKEILDGFSYTVIGKGIVSQKNKDMIIDSIQMLCDKYPENKIYSDALELAKQK